MIIFHELISGYLFIFLPFNHLFSNILGQRETVWVRTYAYVSKALARLDLKTIIIPGRGGSGL